MEEESHLNPLPKNHPRSEEFAMNINKPLNIEEGRSSKAVVYILLVVVLLSIGFLIFGLVVLRVEHPTLRLSNVVVQGLRYNSSSSLYLNMTVIAGLRLRNMNFGRFRFHAGSATLFYGNATIGAAAIDGGEVGGRKRREMSATVEVNYVNISGESTESDLVKLRSYAELRGEIRVMKIVNRRRTALMNCSMDLNLTTQAIQGYSCR